MDKLTGEVARDEKQKWRNITEIDKHEKAIQSLGVEINTKVCVGICCVVSVTTSLPEHSFPVIFLHHSYLD